MRARFLSAAILLALTAPVCAQMNIIAPNAKYTTQEEVDQAIKQEKDYKAIMKKMPDQKASNDPWGTVRSGAPAPTEPKQKPKTKASVQ